GVEGDKKVEENIICSAISRVLSAKQQWKEILQCAHSLSMQIVISNTTEAGLQLVKEFIQQKPPVSFPAKLLAFLYERFKAFNGSAESGMVIIPTELITDNGKILRSFILELAVFNNLGENFINWIKTHNRFCNSLVDRIVPGKPDAAIKENIENELGYTDGLLSICEVYRLWAIEGDENIRAILSFAEADKNVIIAPDIEIYKELKLRLLNATHTLCSGLAYLAGFKTVKEAMDNAAFNIFIKQLMLGEIAIAVPCVLPPNAAENFSAQVLDRFRNPYLKHAWINITLYYSLKMKMRVVPVLQRYFDLYHTVPEHIAMCFAAYILFMKVTHTANGKYYGECNNSPYLINDDHAAFFYTLWQNSNTNNIVPAILKNETLWGTDLSALNGFEIAVQKEFELLLKDGVKL
ncbi:MAG TPA: tagaturonate reductase, partial [Panacibacter sp.]|nr:tagaturonate reductase [Panacibacter sp.]